jgi:hypothetical protein
VKRLEFFFNERDMKYLNIYGKDIIEWGMVGV